MKIFQMLKCVLFENIKINQKYLKKNKSLSLIKFFKKTRDF